MEHTIENNDILFSTPLFWDCECGDRYIHPRAENVCPSCGAEAQNQPNSRVDAVLFNAKFWNLDPGLVGQVWETLEQEHPLLFRAFELGFEPEEEVTIVTFGDLILRLEHSLQNPHSVPAEDLAQLILQSSKFIRIDWQDWDRFTASVLESFQTKASPMVTQGQEVGNL
jgi:hypothetical protein